MVAMTRVELSAALLALIRQFAPYNFIRFLFSLFGNSPNRDNHRLSGGYLEPVVAK
jgi:hypothetical protein